MKTILRLLLAASLCVPACLLSLLLLQVAVAMLGSAYFGGFVPTPWVNVCLILSLATVLPVMALTLLSGYPLSQSLDALTLALPINQMAACALLAVIVWAVGSHAPAADLPKLFEQLQPVLACALALTAYGICKIPLPWPVQVQPQPKSLLIFCLLALAATVFGIVLYVSGFSTALSSTNIVTYLNTALLRTILLLFIIWHTWRGARQGRLFFFFLWFYELGQHSLYSELSHQPCLILLSDLRLIMLTIALGALYWPSARHFLLAVPQCSPSSPN